MLLRETWSQREGTKQEGHSLFLSWDLSLREAPAHTCTPTQGPSPTKAAHGNTDLSRSEGWHEWINTFISEWFLGLVWIDEKPELERREFLIIFYIICFCSPFNKDGWMVIIVNVYWLPPCVRHCAEQSTFSLLFLTTSRLTTVYRHH